jgi:hypothetical protein
MASANWPLLLSLDISNNELSGKLPALKGAQWPLLQILSLNSCGLSGCDFKDLAALPLPSLRHLHLR